MAKKQAKELKKGDKIKLAGKPCVIENVEISELGKQGKKKVRLELRAENSERVVVIRPEDYPFEISK